MTIYLIRHKATGKLMPLMRRGKGYSHWNPSKQEYKVEAELNIPRILESKKQAERCISQWNALPNSRYSYHTTYFGEEVDDLDIKPDGRTKDDLEIIKAQIVFE